MRFAFCKCDTYTPHIMPTAMSASKITVKEKCSRKTIMRASDTISPLSARNKLLTFDRQEVVRFKLLADIVFWYFVLQSSDSKKVKETHDWN
jgi:hypothetical protein